MGVCASSDASLSASTPVGINAADGPTKQALNAKQSGILSADEKITTWRDPDNPNRDPDARPTICADDANVHPYESAVDVNMPQSGGASLPRSDTSATLAHDDHDVHAFEESEDVDKAPASAPDALKKGGSVSILTEEEKTTTWKQESDSDEDSEEAEQRAMMRMMQTVSPDDRNVHEFSEATDVDGLGI